MQDVITKTDQKHLGLLINTFIKLTKPTLLLRLQSLDVFFTDDTELYLAFHPDPASALAAVRTVEECCQDVKAWMTANDGGEGSGGSGFFFACEDLGRMFNHSFPAYV